ncbi:hypothetical protein Acin_1818 [Acidaminococcus intestini RyC-MR95]|uniref:Uncharacterized protein n=1 Tax=Acidaminococcus intestini (strain RyC-MR95) TaxID=568816 RepID=G4Q3W3_ACIIR|nr:hypothetical protein Acin_1818 [Acidaminococcus intestini RyC-MR95]
MNPDGTAIVTVGVRSYCVHWATKFDGPILADYKVIANSCPSLRKMGFMDFLGA